MGAVEATKRQQTAAYMKEVAMAHGHAPCISSFFVCVCVGRARHLYQAAMIRYQYRCKRRLVGESHARGVPISPSPCAARVEAADDHPSIGHGRPPRTL